MRIMYSNTHEYTSGLLLKVSSCHTHTQYHIGREYIYRCYHDTPIATTLSYIHMLKMCNELHSFFGHALFFFLSRREEIKKIMSIHTTLAILFPTAHAYTHTHIQPSRLTASFKSLKTRFSINVPSSDNASNNFSFLTLFSLISFICSCVGFPRRNLILPPPPPPPGIMTSLHIYSNSFFCISFSNGHLDNHSFASARNSFGSDDVMIIL
mmetsp:Transcript_24249/g.35251  ORF Transcript_24249/g.35251 Transcript_24249/m.35251 type:complete len:210 (+) Transcript_24249:60-689(+)